MPRPNWIFPSNAHGEFSARNIVGAASGASFTVSVASSSMAVTGASVNARLSRRVAVSSGNSPVTGTVVSLHRANYTGSITPGAVALSGAVVNLRYRRKLFVASSLVPLIGDNVSALYHQTVIVVPGFGDLEEAIVSIQFASVEGGAYTAFRPDVWRVDVWGAAGLGNWFDVTDDILVSEQPTFQYGILDSSPNGLTADAGVGTIALDNSRENQARVAGRYSPLHALARGGWNFNIPVRFVFEYDGDMWVKYQGKLANIHVSPGSVNGDKIVRATVVDLFDDWANWPAPRIPIQFNKTGDQLIYAILANLPSDLVPSKYLADVGPESFALAMDNEPEESRTVLQLINDVVQSDRSKAVIHGVKNDSTGPALHYLNRHSAAFDTSVKFAFDNDMEAMEMPGSREDIVNTVQVTLAPIRTDPTNETVLYALHQTGTFVPPLTLQEGLIGPYFDPEDTSVRVGGYDMQQPVRYTDYTLNSQEDGTGVDLTPLCVIAADYSGSTSAWFNIYNGSAQGAYITFLQCRGRGVYRGTSVISKNVTTTFGQRQIKIRMPFQSSVNIGTAAAEFYAAQLSRVSARVYSVTFLANKTPEKMRAALELEPNDRIMISETQSGLVEQEFFINAVRFELGAGKPTPIYCTWWLTLAEGSESWFLGVEGSSELGSTTYLGY